MAQNIYDDQAFFEGYSQFPRSRMGLAGAPEWPSLKGMLPGLNGARVLDLGCGFGAFCRWAVEQGAAEVVGVDLSSKMLASAAERGPGLPIAYEQADLETYQPQGKFELIYSSLAVHYLADFDALCARIKAALVPGGAFVFSMEHPIFAARGNPEWLSDGEGYRVFALSDYAREGERVTNWVVDGIVKYHRKISTIVTALVQAGFVIDAMDEWSPTQADLEANPGLADEIVRPMLLLMAVHVPQTKL
ncbi:SAM-dependent methyltransferase [Devosia sp. UYZn731]|uniref:class I SAM-dependent methyltransferase n=1 Tax=Devosia sp. UYZn731 TaxID=3156345 RepID=UPI003394EE15